MLKIVKRTYFLILISLKSILQNNFQTELKTLVHVTPAVICNRKIQSKKQILKENIELYNRCTYTEISNANLK